MRRITDLRLRREIGKGRDGNLDRKIQLLLKKRRDITRRHGDTKTEGEYWCGNRMFFAASLLIDGASRHGPQLS